MTMTVILDRSRLVVSHLPVFLTESITPGINWLSPVKAKVSTSGYLSSARARLNTLWPSSVRAFMAGSSRLKGTSDHAAGRRSHSVVTTPSGGTDSILTLGEAVPNRSVSHLMVVLAATNTGGCLLPLREASAAVSPFQ